MQLVSRDILFQLASGQEGEVTEGDGGKSFSFQDFTNEYKRISRIKTKSNDWTNRYDDKEGAVYDSLKQSWLKEHCPPIKFVGEGSSRAAFACSGGKCLKVAMNQKGLAQNKQEVQNTNGLKKYACFPALYEYDKKTYGSLLTECCAEAKERDFHKIFGLGKEDPLDDFEYLFDYLEINKFDFKRTLDYVNKLKAGFLKQDFKNTVKRLDRLAQIITNCMTKYTTEPQWASLHDVVQFYVDHGRNDKKLLIGDLMACENWGLILRDKKLSLVIIDAGFSETINNKYYN